MAAPETAPVIAPVLGASIALFEGGKVLLAQRGRGWRAGAWSLPGGRVEPGETLAETALREAREEIGVTAELYGFVDFLESIERDEAGALRHHFIVCVFAGRIIAGTPALSEECAGLAWVDPGDPGPRDMTFGLPGMLARAAALVSETKR
jgi:ADP-ribose pyrophosphatase YjhB (NUDIX family)